MSKQLHTPANDPLVLHPAPFLCHFGLYFAFYSRFQCVYKVWRHRKLCNIVYTQFGENPAQQHTHPHQKRTRSAYNQRKEESWASSVLGLHNSQEWCSGRPGWHLLGGNKLPDKYMYLPLYLLETPDLQRAHSYLVSIPWALREADPDSVPLSASLSVWYSTGEVEPGFIRTENTQMWMKELGYFIRKPS